MLIGTIAKFPISPPKFGRDTINVACVSVNGPVPYVVLALLSSTLLIVPQPDEIPYDNVNKLPEKYAIVIVHCSLQSNVKLKQIIDKLTAANC